MTCMINEPLSSNQWICGDDNTTLYFGIGCASSGSLYHWIFDASSSWPSGPRAGWSAILRGGHSWGFELLLWAFYPASVRVSLSMKNLPRWHCERVSIFVKLRGAVPLFLLHARNWWWKLNHRYSHYWLVIQWKYPPRPFLTRRWSQAIRPAKKQITWLFYHVYRSSDLICNISEVESRQMYAIIRW